MIPVSKFVSTTALYANACSCDDVGGSDIIDRCASFIYRVSCCPLLDQEPTLGVEYFEEVDVMDVDELDVDCGVGTVGRGESFISC